MVSSEGNSYSMNHIFGLQDSQESFQEGAISFDLKEVRTSSFRMVLRAGWSTSPRAPIPLGPMSTVLIMTKMDVL